MDTHSLISLISIAFGVGGFSSSFVVMARVTALIEKTRTQEREYMEKHFIRKPA